jgi:hypothetical protein
MYHRTSTEKTTKGVTGMDGRRILSMGWVVQSVY